MQQLLLGVLLATVVTAAGAADVPAPPAPLFASSLMEMQVRNANHEYCGYISDLLLDDKGSISNVVLRVGDFFGMGERRYVVPWSRLRIEADGKSAFLDVIPDHLAAEFPVLDAGVPLTGGPGGEVGR